MKSFGKVLSVLVLSLFCSFFVRMEVSADNTVGEVYNMSPFEGFTSSAGICFNGVSSSSAVLSITPGSNYRSYSQLIPVIGYVTRYVNWPAYGSFTRVVADTVDGEVYVVKGNTHMTSGSFSLAVNGELSVSLTGFQTYHVGDASVHYVDTYYLWCRPSNSESAVLVGSYSADGSVNDFEFEFTSSGGDITLYFYLSGSDSSYESPLSVVDDFVFRSSFYWHGSNVSINSYPSQSISSFNKSFSVPVCVNDLTYEIKQEWTENDPYLEQMKQTNDLLTNFPGSGDMDASKGQLDSAIGDYDQLEGSLFDSSKAAFDQFDPSSLFNFTVGIYSAIAILSDLMIEIIVMMGEFSVLYTISAALIFFGMLIGLWRYFTK